MNDNRFVMKLDVPVHSRAELFQYVSDELMSSSSLSLAALMAEREENGSVEIAEEVVLPHIESDLLEKSQVFVIRPKAIITWDEHISRVKLVIMILLKKNETVEVKKNISQFTRKLADEDYLDKLMKTEIAEIHI